tara:strand:- start:21 stop:2297 length:2277 start_codon:yes stop_codon:yes gene_type:complete
MGLLTLLEDGDNLFYYSSKGYTSGVDTPGMKSANDFYLINENSKPLITFDINDNGKSDVSGIDGIEGLSNLSIGGEGGSSDFLLRGGLKTFSRSAIDVARLQRWGDTNLNRFQFFLKQSVLSRINPKTEASKDGGYAFGALNAGVYTFANTQAQAAVNAFGIHLNKNGVLDGVGSLLGLDFDKVLGLNNYFDVVKENSNIDNFNKVGGNRLVRLNQKIKDGTEENLLPGFTNNRYFLNANNTHVIEYGGGPKDAFGLGGTTLIPFADQRTGENNPNLLNLSFFEANETSNISGLKIGNYSVFKRGEIKYDQNNIFKEGIGVSSLYTTLIEETANPIDLLEEYNNIQFNLHNFETSVYTPLEAGTFPENTDRIGKGSWKQEDFINQPKTEDNEILEDFRKKLDPSSKPQSTFLSTSPNYKNKNIEKRVLLGDPGKKGNISNYQLGKRDTLGRSIGPTDRINALPVYKDTGVTPSFELKNDLCKFRIAVIDPNDPSKKTFIHFRAFLDNFSDGYQAEWKGQKYMGRAEELFKYGGFSRDISISFTVAAQSKEELYPMYRKLNFLASSLAPTYTTKGGYMAGNLSQMTVGGYLFEQPGFISSVDYEIPQESPWEISIPSTDQTLSVGNEGFENSSLKEMPHIINVSLKFTPIHRFRPAINNITSPNNANSGLNDGNTYGKERFIGISDGNSNGYDQRIAAITGSSSETQPTPPLLSSTPPSGEIITSTNDGNEGTPVVGQTEGGFDFGSFGNNSPTNPGYN